MAQENLGVRINQAAAILGISRSVLRSYTNDGLIQPIEGNAASVQRGIRYSSASILQFTQDHPELLGEGKTPEDVFNDINPLDSNQDVSSDDSVTSDPATNERYFPNIYARQALKETYGFTDDQINNHPDFVRSDHVMSVIEARQFIGENPPDRFLGSLVHSETVNSNEEVDGVKTDSPSLAEIYGVRRTDESIKVERNVQEATSRPLSPLTNDAAEGITHFIFGLGATGVQIVDQALRSDYYAKERGVPSLDTPYSFFVIDTSVDVDPQRPPPGRSHTREGYNKWFENSDIIILSNLTGGAGRVPVVSEFIASHTLELQLKQTAEMIAKLRGINTSYLVHSIGGGTGCGLAPSLARHLRESAQGGTRISMTLLGNASGLTMNTVEAENSLYAFPKVNSEMDLVVLIDNSTVFQRIQADNRTKTETNRYLNELDDIILNGIPEYMEPADHLYEASDRYAYRIISSLSRLPEDITNVITFLNTNDRFHKGSKWVLPFIYPLNADFEYDYRDVPPALFILRALQKGNLCESAEIRPDSLAVVICEFPEDYPQQFVIDLPRQAQEVVGTILGIEEKNVRVVPFRTKGEGFSVTVLVAGTEPSIFNKWREDAQDQKVRDEIQDRWIQRVSVTDTEEGILGGSWDAICQLTAQAVKDTEDEQNDFANAISQSAVEHRDRATEYDVCEAFLEFAEKTGYLNSFSK